MNAGGDPRFDPVEAWRLENLLEAGYPSEVAVELAICQVDLHKAIELVVDRGCPPELAGRILL
jgi:hypothetical protein